jgi:hypothetical protein
MTTRNSANPYLGRLGALIDDALYLLNDLSATSWHNVSGVAGAANRGYQQIAKEGYWDTDLTLTPVDGTETYDIRDTDPRALAINSVRPADTQYGIKHYVNWPDLDGMRASSAATGISYTFGYYVKGTVIRLVNAPSACGDLTINYSYSPADLGKIIQLNSAAVVNKGGGLVGLPATAHGEIAGAEITVYGTTNVNGTFTLDALTSANELVVADTYVAETLTSTAKAQPVAAYTPDWPLGFDDVLQYFTCREAWSRDLSRDGADAQWNKFNALYLGAKADLYDALAGDEGLSMQPSRG